MQHLDNLEKIIGSLGGERILDIGSGEGDFLIGCAKKGYDAVGIELNPVKIEITRKKAETLGLGISIRKGEAETMPFEDDSFGFANASELIEHVNEPDRVLKEIFRVLKPGGSAYMSVHNRFGLYDTHFHVYFLGCVPRALADVYLSLLGKHKNYHNLSGRQRIQEMHYFTFNSFKNLARKAGLHPRDIREIKIQKRFSGFSRMAISLIYKMFLRPFCFSTFHILLNK